MPGLREQLIKADLWNADDARDPAYNPAASTILLSRMKKPLEKGAYISYCVSLDRTPSTEVFINYEGKRYCLAMDVDLYIAICKAALMLPEILRQYPECAAKLD